MNGPTFATAMSVAAIGATTGANTDAYLVAAIVLGLVGLAILVIELFIPSGGLLAILCAVSFVGSVVAMYMWGTLAGTVLLFGYLASSLAAIPLFLKLWSKSPLVRKYTLQDGPNVKVIRGAARADVDPEDPDAEQAASDDARQRRLRDDHQYIGRQGVAETPLRPIGFVRIGDRRLDASAETGLIDAGTPVRVVAVVDGTLKVRPV